MVHFSGASHHLRYGICVVASAGKIWLVLVSMASPTHGIRLALTAVTALAILQLLGSSYGSRSGHYPHYLAVRISNTYSRLGSQPQNRKWALAASPKEGPRPHNGRGGKWSQLLDAATVILSSGKLSASEKPKRSSPVVHPRAKWELRQIFAANVSCG
jgi:hypothetical protein